jgi:uncharacterized protein YcgI (DUF1989 family)
MTKPVHTTPPPDAPARRRARPVLTYSVEQLPSLDTAFYNRARAEVSKVAELTVPPREAKALEVSAGHLFRIVSVEGPQAGTSAHVTHLQAHEIAAAKLAVDRKVEQSKIAFAALQLKPDPNCPNIFWLQRALLADQVTLVPWSLLGRG